MASKQARRLNTTEIRVADLLGSYIGLAASNVIWIDQDAAGYGWFVDASPEDDDTPLAGGYTQTSMAAARADTFKSSFGGDPDTEGIDEFFGRIDAGLSLIR